MALFNFLPDTRIKSAQVNSNFQGLADGSEITNVHANVIQNPYMFYAYRNGNYTESSGSRVELNAENFDTNDDFNTSTFIYTVPVTGYYQMNWRLTCNVDAGLGYYASLRRNSAELARGSSVISAYTNSGGWGGSNGAGLFYLTAGDSIDLYFVGSASDTIFGTDQETFFSGFLVSKDY